jgi:hypothetical protein
VCVCHAHSNENTQILTANHSIRKKHEIIDQWDVCLESRVKGHILFLNKLTCLSR